MSGGHVVALGLVEIWFVNCSDLNNLYVTTRGYFDEAVEDEEELREMGGNSSARDIFRTLATDFRTDAPALEHLFLNSARPNLVAPVLSSL